MIIFTKIHEDWTKAVYLLPLANFWDFADFFCSDFIYVTFAAEANILSWKNVELMEKYKNTH